MGDQMVGVRSSYCVAFVTGLALSWVGCGTTIGQAGPVPTATGVGTLETSVSLPVFEGAEVDGRPSLEVVWLPIEGAACEGRSLSHLRKPALPHWMGAAELGLSSTEWNVAYRSPRAELGGPAVACHISCQDGVASAVLHVLQPGFEGAVTCEVSPQTRLIVNFDRDVREMPHDSQSATAWEATQCLPPWICPTWSITDPVQLWVETTRG